MSDFEQIDELKQQQQQQQQQVKINDLNDNNISVKKPLENEIKQPEVSKNQIQKDMQNGNDIVQSYAEQTGWVVMDKPEETLDEKFINARLVAHKHEQNVSKIKKSTLKKRRAEYARKNAEREKMLEVKERINALTSGKLATGLQNSFDQLATKAGQPMDQVSDKVKTQAMHATMFFQKREETGIGADDMSVMYRDLCFDVSKTTEEALDELSEKEQKKVIAQFGSKMTLYEKMFSEVLGWKPEDFAFKDNHSMTLDPNFQEKMEKLSMLTVVKDALAEYKTVTEDGRMESLRSKSSKAFLPPELMEELEVRLEFYDTIHNDIQTRMDLMSNKYYALLGKSDTANMSLSELEREGNAETSTSKDPEMIAYFDALRRTKQIKQTGKEMKGKKPAAVLEKMKKSKDMPTGKKAKAAMDEIIASYARAHKQNEGNVVRRRMKALSDSEESSLRDLEIQSPEMIDFQIDVVNKKLGMNLSRDDKLVIRANYKDRLKDSRHAASLVSENLARRKALEKELNDRLFAEFSQGLKTELREEREGILEYLLSPEFQTVEGKKKQYEIYRTFMLPYLDRSEVNPIKDKEESDNVILQVFRESLKKDNQLDILSKYKDPKDFAAHATQEDFNRLMQLRHIGGWVNHLIFEKKDKKLISLMDKEEYKAMFVQLKYAAYEFSTAVRGEVDLMANSNYAFMNDAEVDSLIASRDVNSSLQAMKDRKIKVDEDKGNFRIGANAAKRMEADAKLFDKSPELWTVYAKYHKDEASLYSDSYSSIYSGVAFDSDMLMPELSALSDEELMQKKADTADRLMKDQDMLDTCKAGITEEFKQRKAKVSDYLAGYEKEDNKGQKIQVKGELDRIQERVNDLIGKFREGGNELKGAASKYLINDIKAVNDQLNNLLKADVFMLSDISQKKVWDMVSLVRPVLDYAKELEEDAEYIDQEDEDYTPPKYEDFEEDFLAGLLDFKKETLEKAKEADPSLKAYLELPEYEKRVQDLEITLRKIERTQSQRKKIKKESNAENRQEMTKQYHEQRKIVNELSKNVSDTLKNQDYYGMYRTAYTMMVQKYNKPMLEDIDNLNTAVLTKDKVQEIAQDFEFFKKLIEDDKIGNIFSMPEDLANALWDIYDSLAPVAAYAKKNSGEPDMDAISKLQKDTSIKVNRENAEDAFRGRLIFGDKDKESFAYMKAEFASSEKAYLIYNVINE